MDGLDDEVESILRLSALPMPQDRQRQDSVRVERPMSRLNSYLIVMVVQNTGLHQS